MSRLKRLVVEVHRRSLWQMVLVYIGVGYAIFQIGCGLVPGYVRYGQIRRLRWLPAS